MRNAAIIIVILGLIAGALYWGAPYLKPNNNAFAPKTPSQQVSPRLKGIFSGMQEGFSK